MRCMHRHIIVSGDDALATTIADELKHAGATIVRMAAGETSEAGVARELTLADVSHALAVVCAASNTAAAIANTPGSPPEPTATRRPA